MRVNPLKGSASNDWVSMEIILDRTTAFRSARKIGVR
jgi:hypothetical protein